MRRVVGAALPLAPRLAAVIAAGLGSACMPSEPAESDPSTTVSDACLAEQGMRRTASGALPQGMNYAQFSAYVDCLEAAGEQYRAAALDDPLQQSRATV